MRAILAGSQRETARAVRECELLLSAKERRVSHELPRSLTYSEANACVDESAAASGRLAATLTGGCVRALLPGFGPDGAAQPAYQQLYSSNAPSSLAAVPPRAFAILRVLRVDQITEGFAVIDFDVLYAYPGAMEGVHAQ